MRETHHRAIRNVEQASTDRKRRALVDVPDSASFARVYNHPTRFQVKCKHCRAGTSGRPQKAGQWSSQDMQPWFSFQCGR